MVDVEDISKPDEVYLVESRKYGLDASAPKWKHLFFRWVYLPFNRFSFNWVNIPAQGSHDEAASCPNCGTETKSRFSWVEHVTVASDEETANMLCKGEFDAVYPLPLNGELPKESLQYKGHRYPLSVMPDRYRRRTFPYTAQPLDHLTALQEGISRLKKAVGA